ncbi:hypothetical protein DM02DRAFT_430715 [Periconia macrospinosa]|uniref:Uncharacterized protein n=1 Tax=Periconia macrospinosa TaxID=97972 RepID=A0A2V1DQV7_9PLEO|nr:hypothetical protein DM02DRAFT_430715 [Periconia macrospinosa]
MIAEPVLLIDHEHTKSPRAGLMLVLLLLPTFTIAQNIVHTSSGVSGTTSRVEMPTTLLTTTSPTQNSTISSIVPTKTVSPPSDLIPGFSGSDSGSDSHPQENGVINYYFLFIALFGVGLAVGLYWIQKRRRQRKEQTRAGGQNALARDMEGWVNTRRWFHGSWRQNQTAVFVRREEGLNEQGEAPPPYQPNSNIPVPRHQDAASGLAIPLRAVSRQDHEQGTLPEYREAVNSGNISTNRDVADTPESLRTSNVNVRPEASAEVPRISEARQNSAS